MMIAKERKMMKQIQRKDKNGIGRGKKTNYSQQMRRERRA